MQLQASVQSSSKRSDMVCQKLLFESVLKEEDSYVVAAVAGITFGHGFWRLFISACGRLPAQPNGECSLGEVTSNSQRSRRKVFRPAWQLPIKNTSTCTFLFKLFTPIHFKPCCERFTQIKADCWLSAGGCTTTTTTTTTSRVRRI
jgi:hypothetical protein